MTSMGNSQIRRFDGTTGVEIDLFRAGWPVPAANVPNVVQRQSIRCDIRSGWQPYVSSASFGGVKRFDVPTGALIDVFADDLPHTGLRFGPDGNLYVASFDRGSGTTVRLAPSLMSLRLVGVWLAPHS